uniref:RING finger family protein n=1 Tax=Clandestinovirus TaxID=2831644 RepID=A0A8F8KM62_9VIRU|nr:RING finger family protein [Clandestinovirus]
MTSVSINIDDYLEDGLNIGGLVQRVAAEHPNVEFTRILLQVCNSTWHGSFVVPVAVGFSTPLNLCKGGVLTFDQVDECVPMLQLQYWATKYRSVGCRKDDTFTFTSTHGECLICMQEYKVGDNLIRLESCGHVYHSQCHRQMILHEHSKEAIVTSLVMETRLETKCPACNTQTS